MKNTKGTKGRKPKAPNLSFARRAQLSHAREYCRTARQHLRFALEAMRGLDPAFDSFTAVLRDAESKVAAWERMFATYAAAAATEKAGPS